MYSRAKILGHPVHPILVSYPIALYTATLVAYIIYVFQSFYPWIDIAIAANTAGVVMAVIAAVPGFIDWSTGVPSGTEARRHCLIHMSLNVAALILFAINLAIHIGYWQSFTVRPHSGLGIILALLGVGCTVAAGYFGWTLVQRDHVGIQLSPEQERLETPARF